MTEIPLIAKLRSERDFIEGMNILGDLSEDKLRKSFELVTNQEYPRYYFTKTKEFADGIGITDEKAVRHIFGATLFLVGAIFIAEYSLEDVIENLKPIFDKEEKAKRLAKVLQSIASPEVKNKVKTMHITETEISEHMPNISECGISYTFDKRAIFVDNEIQKFIPVITISLSHKEKSFTFQSTIANLEEFVDTFQKLLSMAQKLKK